MEEECLLINTQALAKPLVTAFYGPSNHLLSLPMTTAYSVLMVTISKTGHARCKYILTANSKARPQTVRRIVWDKILLEMQQQTFAWFVQVQITKNLDQKRAILQAPAAAFT